MKKTNLKETLQNWKLGNYFRELSIVITGVFITHKQFLTRKADKRKYANDKNGIRRKFEKYQSGQSRVFK